jgi:hypothetical protein
MLSPIVIQVNFVTCRTLLRRHEQEANFAQGIRSKTRARLTEVSGPPYPNSQLSARGARDLAGDQSGSALGRRLDAVNPTLVTCSLLVIAAVFSSSSLTEPGAGERTR